MQLGTAMRGWLAQARRYLGLLLPEIELPLLPEDSYPQSREGSMMVSSKECQDRVSLPVALSSTGKEHNSQGRVAEAHRQDLHMPVSVPADQDAGLSYLLLRVCLFAPPGKAGSLLPLWCSFPHSTSWHRSVSPWHGSAIHVYLSQSVHHR